MNKVERVFIYIVVFLIGVSNSYAYLNHLLPYYLGDYIRIITVLFVSILFLLTLFHILKQKGKLKIVQIIIFLLIIVVLINFLLSILNAEFSVTKTQDTIFFITNMFILLVFTSLDINYKENTNMVLIFVFSLLPSFLIPILFYPDMIGVRMSYFETNNIEGAFWNYSIIAYLSVFWLVLFIVTKEKSLKLTNKIIILLTAFSFIIGSLLGISRSFIIVFLFSIILYLLLQKKVKNIAINIILIMTTLIFIFVTFREYIADILERGMDFSNLASDSRFNIYREYLHQLDEVFIFGYLGENYRELTELNIGTHSMFLNYIFNYGVFALFLILIIFLIILKMLKKLKFPSILTVAFFNYVIYAAFNETGFSEIQVYLFLGILIKFIHLERYVYYEKKNDINNNSTL